MDKTDRHPMPPADAREAEQATAELAELRAQVKDARAVLARLRVEVASAEARVSASPAAHLREANEQLVMAALHAQATSDSTLLALEEVSQAAVLTAGEHQRASEAMERLNASLEERVRVRTHELELARDEALAGVCAKEQFLSNMSHEIRTPLNGMLGALELLSNTRRSVRQHELISVASASGAALLGILNEVLDFAKIGANGFRLKKEPVEVNAIAMSVTTMFSAAARRQGVALRLEADARLAGWRIGDALRLRQVLMNLVGNALKFTTVGSITVSTIDLDDDAVDLVGFAVADTGVGIDASEHERIFDVFVQADDSAQQPSGGTGLGLAISRQLVKTMGGDLSVTSAPGQGATFRFEVALPRTSPDARVRDSGAAGSKVFAPFHSRVMLVEDNSVNRLIGTAMLESLGLEVVQADQGEEALALLPNSSVSAVLMDCNMPVLDGYEATRRLRTLETLSGSARMPVIALTANAFSGDVARCMAAGMDAHLAKPYTIEQLRDTLAPWLVRAEREPAGSAVADMPRNDALT